MLEFNQLRENIEVAGRMYFADYLEGQAEIVSDVARRRGRKKRKE